MLKQCWNVGFYCCMMCVLESKRLHGNE